MARKPYEQFLATRSTLLLSADSALFKTWAAQNRPQPPATKSCQQNEGTMRSVSISEIRHSRLFLTLVLKLFGAERTILGLELSTCLGLSRLRAIWVRYGRSV